MCAVNYHLSILRLPHGEYEREYMRSFASFDILGFELATLDAMFMLFHWYSAGLGCAYCRALGDTNTNALVVTEVDHCVHNQRKLMADWWDIA